MIEYFNVIPRVGIGPLKLGMSYSEVELALGKPAKIFKAGPFAKTNTAQFDDYFIQVDFDPFGAANLITAFALAKVKLFDATILRQPVSSLESMQSLHMEDPDQDDSGLIYRSLGIYIYSGGDPRQKDAVIEAVQVFVDGYFD